MFIRDMLGPDTYFYMGGNSWGVGIDYELDFKPDFSGAPFWLTACTSRVYGLQWTKDSFSAELRGLLRDDCEIVLHVEAPVSTVRMQVDGVERQAAFRYDPRRSELIVSYRQTADKMQVALRLC